MTDQTNAIDKAIAAAQARKAAKEGGPAVGAPATKEPKPAKEPKTPKEPKEPKRVKPSDEEKAAKQAAKDAERATRKAEREVLRATKKAEKDAARKPAHMSKVEKAAEKLPELNAEAQNALNEITSNFTAAQVSALASHLQYFNRVKATERALTQKLTAGDTVRIVSGDARFIGCEGTVTKSQRIRCYCSVPGAKKDVYLFTSDVEVIAQATAQATGTEG